MNSEDVLGEGLKNIVSLAQELREAVARGASGADDVSALRFRLSIAARQHSGNEQDLLLSRLDEDHKKMIPSYEDAVAMVLELRKSYSLHVSRWSKDAIAQDYPRYISDVRMMVDKLMAHCHYIEREFYGPAFRALASNERA